MDIAQKPEPAPDKPASEETVQAQETADSDAEAQALLGLAQWINCQGDSGEAAELMDETERRIPQKFQG